MVKKIILHNKYTVELANDNPNCIFIFGDNLMKKGTGGQACIRYCKNSFGVPTKKYPSCHENAYFTDNEYDCNCDIIINTINKLREELNKYDFMIFPLDGLGTGLAKLNECAPSTFNFLKKTMNTLFDDIERENIGQESKIKGQILW